jgi:hypothetical protein
MSLAVKAKNNAGANLNPKHGILTICKSRKFHRRSEVA